MANAYNPNTWEVEAEGSAVQGYPLLYISSRPAWATRGPVLGAKQNRSGNILHWKSSCLDYKAPGSVTSTHMTVHDHTGNPSPRASDSLSVFRGTRLTVMCHLMAGCKHTLPFLPRMDSTAHVLIGCPLDPALLKAYSV